MTIFTSNEYKASSVITTSDILTSSELTNNLTTERSDTMRTKMINLSLEATNSLSAQELFDYQDQFDNLKLENNQIKLINNNEDGVYVSRSYIIRNCLELVTSWNILIDNNSAVTIKISIGNDIGFSKFYYIAYWSENYKASLANQEDEYGKVVIDTIIPKVEINKLKIMFEIKGNNSGNTTALRNISITQKLNSIKKYNDFSILEESFNDVAPRNQMSVPEIGGKICSPTSLSMIMNYYNHSESQTEVADIVFDKGANIYGNWSFNASYAGGFEELFSRVEYISDVKKLSDYLASGTPLVLSIKTSSKDDLQGSKLAYTSGHLIVIIGLKYQDNIWYAIVNDPADKLDATVQRIYILMELLAAWKGYAYVVSTSSL